MQIFETPNRSGTWRCPICGTNKDSPVTLIPIEGTLKGRIMEAVQIHIECLDLTIYKNGPVKFIAQDIREDKLK